MMSVYGLIMGMVYVVSANVYDQVDKDSLNQFVNLNTFHQFYNGDSDIEVISEQLILIDECSKVVYLGESSVESQLNLIRLPYIQPYLQSQLICFIINNNQQSPNSINDNDDKYLKKSEKTQINEQVDERLYYLRVDYMPNQCLNIKNDLPFLPLQLNAFKTTDKLLNNKFLIAKVNISRQCAKLSTQDNQSSSTKRSQQLMKTIARFQQLMKTASSQQQTKTIISQQQTQIVVQVKQVIVQLFGFPIYKHPFTQLSYLLLLLIITYLSIPFLQNKFNINFLQSKIQ